MVTSHNQNCGGRCGRVHGVSGEVCRGRRGKLWEEVWGMWGEISKDVWGVEKCGRGVGECMG